MITKAEFDAWSRKEKAKTLWLGGLTFRWSDQGGRTILYRHWPHLCCWSWSLSFGPSHPSHPKWHLGRMTHNAGGQCRIGVGVGEICFSWQKYDRIASSRFRDKKVNWDREHGRNTIMAKVDTWPVKRHSIRIELMKRDLCPECGGCFDTGWECNDCRFDGRSDPDFDSWIKREIAIEEAQAS